MKDFNKIQIGEKFIYKGFIYIKINESTAISLQGNKEKVRFFDGNEQIELIK